MITKFKLYESINNVQINVNLPEEELNYLIDTMSFVVYKGTKRDQQKSKNYKSVRIANVSGSYNGSHLQNKELINDCSLQIEMTNKDKIEANYIRRTDMNKVIENSVYIEINGEPQYHLDNETFNVKMMISMIATYYKKYIENKKWKIK